MDNIASCKFITELDKRGSSNFKVNSSYVKMTPGKLPGHA